MMMMTAWLLIIALALGLGLLVIVGLALQRRGREQADFAGRKRKHEDVPADPFLIRLEDQGAAWLEGDGELPADLADVLAEGEKLKRREDE